MKKIYFLIVVSISLLAIAATPPSSRISGSPNNSPQFPVPPEFCSVIKQNVEGDTQGILAANTDFVMHFGQRFTASSNYNVCRIYLKCGYEGTPGTNTVRVSIYSHNPAGDGEPDTPIDTSTPIPCINFPVVSGTVTNDMNIAWTRFDIPPVAISSGTTYWLVAYEPKAGIFSGNKWHWFREAGSISIPNNEVNCNVNVFPGTPWIQFNDNTQFKYRLQGQEPL